jgi:hypothetical protein
VPAPIVRTGPGWFVGDRHAHSGHSDGRAMTARNGLAIEKLLRRQWFSSRYTRPLPPTLPPQESRVSIVAGINPISKVRLYPNDLAIEIDGAIVRHPVGKVSASR